jgi:D-alanyl-D-alanine carboxypeptidase (penicillin-binding protein 5/6)
MIRFSIAVLSLFVTLGAAAATVVPSPPRVAAKAYILLDAASGKVLVEENADMPLPPASLTKMMTAYVLASEMAAGRVKADDMVTVSENAWSQNPVFKGSSLMWIEPGKPVSIADLERGIVISSGNDATVAVAEHLAGSEAGFADMMNGHAEALGLRDSYFRNSHGLPDPEHVMSARDLATLAVAMVQRFPAHYAVYKEREFTYNGIRQYNRNTLLAEDPSVDGIKTGHTEEAGYGLVASAERRGMRLVSVVLGTRSTNSRKNETRALLNYGFRFFETVEQYGPAHELAQARVWKGDRDQFAAGLQEATVLTLPRGKRNSLQEEVVLDPEIEAPLAVGDPVGTLRLIIDGEVQFEAPIVALEAVEQGGFFSRLWDMFIMWLSSLFRG